MSRTIITTYYADLKGKKLVKANSAKWSERAVATALLRMRRNDYGAMLAEVYDTETGTIHAVLRFKVTSNLQSKVEILYQRELKENEVML